MECFELKTKKEIIKIMIIGTTIISIADVIYNYLKGVLISSLFGSIPLSNPVMNTIAKAVKTIIKAITTINNFLPMEYFVLNTKKEIIKIMMIINGVIPILILFLRYIN